MIPSLFAGLGFIPVLGLFFLNGLLILAATIFWIWMLIDCATNQRLKGTDKIIWILIVLFLNWLGGLIYFLVIRNKRV